MFTALKNIVPQALKKNNINTRIQEIERKEGAEEVLKKMFGKGITVVRCGKDLAVRTSHHAQINEIALKEKNIKNRLKESGIVIEKIRCV